MTVPGVHHAQANPVNGTTTVHYDVEQVALDQADAGFAIGAGTDVAVETADIVLMKFNPADVVTAIEVSKATLLKRAKLSIIGGKS